MKKRIKFFLIVITALIIIFLPYLLIVDFDRFAPIVLLSWAFMTAAFIFIKKNSGKNDHEN